MNRSIAKTRNQLQRITFKINQLKTKYTGQFTPTITADNSPMSHSHLRHRQSEENRPSTSNFHHKNNFSGNKHHDDSANDFKVFRNEIYNYVDKCFIMARNRETDMIDKMVQKAVTNQMDKIVTTQVQQSRMGPNKNSLQEKIKKIQEETTNCISNIQNIMTQNGKIEKNLNDKMTSIDSKIRKQIQNYMQNSGVEKILSQVSSFEDNLISLKEQLERENKRGCRISENAQELKLKITRVENEISKKLTQSSSNQQKAIMLAVNNLQAQMEKGFQLSKDLQKQIDHIKIKLQVLKDVEHGLDNEDIFDKIQTMINSQINNHTNQVKNQIEELQASFNVVSSEKQRSLSKLEQKIQTIFISSQNLSSQLQSQESDIRVLQNKTKSMCIKLQEQKQELASTISVLFSQAESAISKKSQKLQNDLKAQMESEIKQSAERLKQQVLELTEQGINKMKIFSRQIATKNTQYNANTTNKINEIRQSMMIIIQQQIQSKFDHQSQLLYEKNKVPFRPVSSVDTLQKHKTSPTQSKHSQSQPQFQNIKYQSSPSQSNQKVQFIIEEKLTEFQNDINETIKLLYEDIENKVNDILSLSGLEQIKMDLEANKRDLIEMETKITSLTLIATTNPNQVENLSNEIGGIEELRAEVFQQMGGQIEKISNILERTVEEIEIKVEKLDNNFEYVYERMSNIEYDNANFKDQLTAFISVSCQKPQQSFSNQIASFQSVNENLKQEQNSNLLDMLGQYNTGKSFFENEG